MKMHATRLRPTLSLAIGRIRLRPWTSVTITAGRFAAYFTMDAGPNASSVQQVKQRVIFVIVLHRIPSTAVAYPSPAPYPIND